MGNKPYPKFIDFKSAVSMGLEGFDSIKIAGHGQASTTSSPIWTKGGPHTYITTAKYVKLVSDDTDDTTADTGAREVTIYGVAAGYTSQSETITMTGFVGKTSTMEYLRINKMEVTAAGSSGYNEGLIVCYPDQAASTATAGTGVLTTTGITMASIATTTNLTSRTIFTVPLSYTAYLTHVHVSCSQDNQIQAVLMTRASGGLWINQGTFHVYRNVDHVPFDYMSKLDSMSDIELRVLGSTSAADVSGMLEMLLVHNQ